MKNLSEIKNFEKIEAYKVTVEGYSGNHVLLRFPQYEKPVMQEIRWRMVGKWSIGSQIEIIGQYGQSQFASGLVYQEI